LREALGRGDPDAVDKRSHELYDCLTALTPRRPCPGLRENLEIVCVAVAVAMGFRTYFLQPFKIPTGSMQPTLYGIHTRYQENPGWSDRLPLKALKWIVTGRWYTEVRAKSSGHLSFDMTPKRKNDPYYKYFTIAGREHRVHRHARMNFGQQDYVRKGDLIWAGIVTSGDHVFVDKLRWNFHRPKRGDIIVFSTHNIPTLPEGTHYIKRLVGMPGERISIAPPNVLADGVPITRPDSIARIAGRAAGYPGYQLVDPRVPGLLKHPRDTIPLAANQYFALGDNTRNSRDGRYWGAVPKANLVGPAFLVYWPFSGRWGYQN
jgi:signal peptidase I